MKKLLLPLLITLSTTILAKTPESLFGVYINDNVLDYVTQKELKSKYRDSARGFYQLRLKNPPISNKSYSDKLWVMFDKNNKIAKIQSEKVFQNSENCHRVEFRARKILETKYDIKFDKNPYIAYGFEKWVGNNYIASACLVNNDNTTLLLYLYTEGHFNKVNDYLNSNI